MEYIWSIKSLLPTTTMKKQKKKQTYLKPTIKVDKVKTELFSMNDAVSKDKCKGGDKQN